MSVKVTNNGTTTLAGGINSSVTSILVADGSVFPTLGASDWFWGTIVDSSNNREVVKVTARATNTLTVTRGQDSSTARSFSLGDRFELRPTAALFNDKADVASPTFTGTVTIPTAAITTLSIGGTTIAPTGTELNYVDGVTSAIQTQIDSKATMASGTVCLFYQSAAPTGWTKVVTQDNKALRVVSGLTGGSAAGSQPFTTAFASQTPAGTVGDTALTKAQIPTHVHTYAKFTVGGSGTGSGGSSPQLTSPTDSTGNGSADGLTGATHTHTFTGTAINLAVQYIDVILASRNA